MSAALEGRLGLILTDLRLPTVKRLALDLCAQSDREGWPGNRLLEALFEHEINECVFRESVTGVFGIVTDDFGNVTGDSGVVTEEVSSQI
ncbi:hypothetical protein [Variovorax sp. GT1P44]|uniref:hypothetical protein n=1 Tax=Variovorax sp. GT1P44 TaxID=3443742 RepID=UPI003F475785